MKIWFDHLVIGAADLDQGREWSQTALGAPLPIGGEHPLMATHNRLARLPEGYLEIIAANPAATPTRPRWYGLDDPAVQARIAERPRPIAFVLATDDLSGAMAAASWEVGEIIEASRADLTWKMGLQPTGDVVEGVLPVLIEWPERLQRRAPTGQMADLGLALRELRLKHPEADRIRRWLDQLGAVEAMIDAGAPLAFLDAAEPSLEAMFTPRSVSARI